MLFAYDMILIINQRRNQINDKLKLWKEALESNGLKIRID